MTNQKRKPGRPRLGSGLLETINVTLDPAVIKRVEELALDNGITRSEAFRQMVRRYLDKIDASVARREART